MDILFLKEEYRNAQVGSGLIKFSEECLEADGVDVVMIGTKAHKSFGVLLEMLGYSEVETFYGKRV